jgi:hypothetical protein
VANTLAINITALDRTTKGVQDITKRMNQMMRPLQNMERSIKQFGRVAGFGVVKEKLEGMRRSATRVAGAFAKIGAPLLALVGGGTIAGLTALTEGWAKFALQLSQTATIFGLNTQQLYNFQNAARLVGISGQAATQTFESFADTLQDARWGRNNPAMGVLLSLGIHLKSTKAGAIDSMDALGQVADKIRALQKAGNTGGARTLARQLGVTSLLPILMQGRKALEAYEAEAQKLAGTIDVNTAAEAAKQWLRLDVAMEGTRNTIAAALLPTITPLVKQFGSWIQANRQLIATDLNDFLKGLGRAFQGLSLKTVLDDVLAVVKGMLSLATDITDVTSHLGGRKTVLEGMAGLWAATKILSFGKGFVQTGLWIGAATKKLIAWRAAQALASGGGAAAAEGAVAGTAARGILGMAGDALGAAALPLGIGLAVNELWNGRMGKLDFNSWGGLFNSMKSTKTHQQQVMGFFQGQGWSKAQAAGITANIQAESGYDPAATGDNGMARGIGQWHPERQAAFNAWASSNKLPGLGQAGLLEQMRFYDYELKHSDAGRRLAGAKSAGEAGAIVSMYGERPAGGAGEATARGALATQIAGPGAAPQVSVSVQNTIHRDGSATTRVQTPSGVKIVHTSPVAGVA